MPCAGPNVIKMLVKITFFSTIPCQLDKNNSLAGFTPPLIVFPVSNPI
jgi:hypothetical protein